MTPRLRRWMVLSLAWLPLAVGAQTSVGDSSAVEPDIKAGNLAYVAGFDTLFRLDLSTGSGSAVGTGFGFAGGAQVADMDSLAFAPDGTLYGVADSPRAALYRLSTASGRAILVAQFRDGGQLIDNNQRLDAAIAFTCSGKLLMASRAQNRLWEVDPATASVRSIGSLAAAIGGMADRAGEVLALGVAGSEGLYRLSEADAGTARLPSALSARAFAAGAIAFDGDGRLWAVLDNYPQAAPVLAELSPVSGAVLRETTITGPQFGTGANSQPVRALAIAPPACSPAGGFGPGATAVPTLDLRALALLGLLFAATGFALRRRFAA
jgi:hypothetical protein